MAIVIVQIAQYCSYISALLLIIYTYLKYQLRFEIININRVHCIYIIYTTPLPKCMTYIPTALLIYNRRIAAVWLGSR